MTAVQTRTFELVSTVTFHGMGLHDMESFIPKLASAVRTVLPEFPAVVAFFIEPDTATGDVNYGLRFSAADPAFVEDMANEILEKAVDRLAEDEGSEPVEAEREESVLVVTR